MSNIIISTVGWIGALLILVAYYLISNDKIDNRSRSYQWMNLFGAIGVAVNAYANHAWPAVGLEFVWALIAIKSLLKLSGIGVK
ncbi:MAG: hypothetical protein HY731_08835 [Candidatus Tectomicrobia bacterium]|nr:hypothetical protein [Candidatus Tectomicrobia bacterium]